MPKNKFHIFILLLVASLLGVSCSESRSDGATDGWDLSQEATDSIRFLNAHHYGIGYNFIVLADSLPLQGDVGMTLSDSATVRHGQLLVVADILIAPEDSVDSVWVKVAHDQTTQGWIHESTLLDSVVPDDPISQFIRAFSDMKFFAAFFLCLFGATVFVYRKVTRRSMHIVHFNDIGSAYPTALCLLTALAATSYSSVRMFAPTDWAHFYFHPTLNPFALPLSLALFMILVWTVIVVAVATIDDVAHFLHGREYVSYMFALLVVLVVVYIFFSGATYFYFGFACLPAYIMWAVRKRRGVNSANHK